ncbi:helix-turn-helix transcriptional regulator [Moritella marina ATCC 15381]|uniref:Helix-turn-helix transcriptional regulator n=1 Tax=Moritella marina ATCC 15381 TaxID=1202962 RepID=A0A5J6WIS2_MORMI|nr:helix-turn-helix transcriptional regulator [Moritella marina]QFI37030.1 helix-turn-helix transcriptional regulator [Moritella marina ATCC 15381]
MKDLAINVGLKIKVRRKEIGVSQDKLALLADIDRSYVGRIERGEVNITLEKLYEIAEVLDCDAKDLLP